MQGRDLARVRADLAARALPDRAAAAERAHRGAALVRAALAGEPVPEHPEPPAAPARHEWVACTGCYRPFEGLPGSRCPACSPAGAPVDVPPD